MKDKKRETMVGVRMDEEQLRKLDYLVVSFRNKGLTRTFSRQATIILLLEKKYEFDTSKASEVVDNS